MMDAFDLASKLFGNSRAESRGDVSNSLDILTATGAGDSSDGAATVYLDADVTPADDYDGDDYAIGIPTSPNVIEGDGVLVGLTGSGPLKTPVVISNPGSGDRMAASVSNAETLAQQAEAVASATGQNFWPDTDGVHVTQVTKDEWNDSTSPNYHSGANVLLNALGQLFRDGLNNILAIVSGTDPGVAIYDGEGNAADNIMALFSKALIRIGGRLLGTGTSTASVQFFESDASQTDVKATHVVGSTTPPTGPDDVYGIEHNVCITTTTDGSELPQLAGVSGWAQLDMSAEVNPDYWAGSAILRARVGDDDEFGDGTPQLGVIRQVAANGIETAEIYMAAPTLALHDNAQYKMGRIPMEQAIAALTTPLYENSGSVAITTTGTGISTLANGPAVTLPAGTYLIVGEWAFNGNGTAARTCRCVIYDATAGQQVGDHQLVTGNGNYCKLQTVSMATLTSQSTIRVRGGCSTTCTATTQKITAVRLS